MRASGGGRAGTGVEFRETGVVVSASVHGRSLLTVREL